MNTMINPYQNHFQVPQTNNGIIWVQGIEDPKWVRTTLRERALKLFAASFPKYFLQFAHLHPLTPSTIKLKHDTVKLRRQAEKLRAMLRTFLPSSSVRYAELLARSASLSGFFISVFPSRCPILAAAKRQIRETASRKAHNLEVVGSTPASATMAVTPSNYSYGTNHTQRGISQSFCLCE